ncbi:vitamin K epoxide reductase family protein [Mycolicibacterium litorale]|uniref:vitamin K epoxide reductase family protein n=1 Tax=Mycolicibacterium litorale TaxID=758802 RepID=UPI003CE75470
MTATAPDAVTSAALPASGPAGRASGLAVPKPSAVWVLIAGVVGLVAAATLTIEKIELLIDPSYTPSCSLNPVLSCGSVMVTPQAALFGFPNPLIGIAAFTVVTVTGVLAVANVRLPRWYWSGLAVGTLLGTVFVHWLIFQSLYRIGALCPYCMVVWAVTIPLLVVVSSIALRQAPAGGENGEAGNPVARAVYQWRWSLTALWFTALMLLILVRFWDYWSTLL